MAQLNGNCYVLGKLAMGLTVEQQADGKAAAEAAGYTDAEIDSLFTPIWSYVIGFWEEVQREYLFDGTVNPVGTGYNYNLATGPNGGVDGIEGPGYSEFGVSSTVFGAPFIWNATSGFGTQAFNNNLKNNNRVDSVMLPRLLVTPRKEVQGPNSIWQFIADYREAQATGDRGAANTIADVSVRTKSVAALYNDPHSFSAAHVQIYGPSIVFGHPFFPTAGNTYSNYQWVLGPTEGTIFEYTRCSIIAQPIYTKLYGSTDPDGANWGPKDIDNVTQTDLLMKTRCFMGIEFWDFQHVDGNNRRVPAFVCPIPTKPADPGTSLEVPPGDALPVCDYTDVQIDTPPRTNPYPHAPPFGGGIMPPPILSTRPYEPYPTYLGALVYDLYLKKWGKVKFNYKQLMDLSPINTIFGDIVTVQRFGMEAAAYGFDAKIYRFDSNPATSYIKYGKIGMLRIGFTTLEEVRVTFRLPVTGTITVSSSLDGRNPERGLVKTTDYTDATWCIMGVGAAGKWHTIKISGNYDITHLEYVGLPQGRR